MGTTTFSGPVVSKAGFIIGTDAVGASVTSATLVITASNGLADAYNGEVIPLNRAAGVTVTLPAATGSQAVYTFLVGTTFTSNGVIQVANSTDTMNGIANVGGGTGSVFSTLPASDTITMNGSTTGGLAGSLITLRDVATGDWIVTANLIGSGSPATPFSAAVS
jgi:hypothetical protein